MKKADQKALLKIALDDIAVYGWLGLSMRRIAEVSGHSLADVHEVFPTKMSIIEDFSKEVDQKTLETLQPFDPDESKKDRLFAVMMARFDVLQAYKPVVERLWQDSWKDPLFLVSTASKGFNSMMWVLQAANIDVSGWLGVYRVKTFAGCYLMTVHTWLQDASPDMAATMAAVDQNLERLFTAPGW